MDLDQLTALFRRLGADDPEAWARSQIEEGIPQLARYLFLRQAWRSVVSEDDTTWIDARIARAEQQPEGPYAGSGRALERLRALGATDEELTDLVRGMQATLLFELCYLLDEPGDLEADVGVDLRWTLVQTNEEGAVLGHIAGLHESVLETDPMGREMRPRRSED
ncbi:MAG: hypothetical protein ACYTG6_06040 [Planctomycetota bacterium]